MDANTTQGIPSHVPPSLVYDFDFFTAPELQRDPHHEVPLLLHKEAPPIFYTPRYGGHWIVTRAAVATDMLRQPDKFSSRSEFNAARMFNPPMLPIQSDPPDHTEYRRLLNRHLAPGVMATLESDIRQLARDIIDEIYPRGRCEFVTEVGQRFPVTIFLRLVNAPIEDRHELVKYAEGYTRSPEFADRVTAVKGISKYLTRLFEERRSKPGNDLLSYLVQSKFRDRPLTADEEEGLATLLFLGGLDTVKSTLSFIILYLARNPDQYRLLTEQRELIGTAVEELLRVNGVSVPERGATADFEYNGIRFKRGDRIIFMTQLYGLDDQLSENPYEVDFDRAISQHFTFGSGPHRCAGSHLARLEIRVFLEEWTSSFPQFGVEDNTEVHTAGGIVWSPVALPLKWPAPAR